jgi:glycosidase
MTNIPVDWPIEEYKDISTQNYWSSVIQSTDDEQVRQAAMKKIQSVARDHGRTPMQWNDGPGGGFTTCEGGPWMRINDNYREINVKQQEEDPGSVLSFWKHLLALRRKYQGLFGHGTWRTVESGSEGTLQYLKSFGDQRAFVILNFADSLQPLSLPAEFHQTTPLLVNQDTFHQGSLGPFEGRIYVK